VFDVGLGGVVMVQCGVGLCGLMWGWVVWCGWGRVLCCGVVCGWVVWCCLGLGVVAWCGVG
jgi:hypothetical protein